MRVLINGVIYDSIETPIVIEFDLNEQDLFNGMKKFVSTHPEYTEKQREELMIKPLEKLQKEYMRELSKLETLFLYGAIDQFTYEKVLNNLSNRCYKGEKNND